MDFPRNTNNLQRVSVGEVRVVMFSIMCDRHHMFGYVFPHLLADCCTNCSVSGKASDINIYKTFSLDSAKL